MHHTIEDLIIDLGGVPRESAAAYLQEMIKLAEEGTQRELDWAEWRVRWYRARIKQWEAALTILEGDTSNPPLPCASQSP